MSAQEKILFIITKSNWGGAQAYVYGLATRLASEGFSVTVAAGGTGAKGASAGQLFELLQEHKVPTHLIRGFTRNIGVLREYTALREIYQLVKKESPTIVHVNSSKAAALGALAAQLAGTPRVVATIHGWAFKEDRFIGVRMLLLILQWIGCLFADTIIVINQHDYATGARLPFIKHKLRLVQNGIESFSTLPRSEARGTFLKHGVPQTEVPWIGSVGELTKNKGYRFALEACRILKNRGVPFIYIIVSEGEERSTLESWVATHDLQKEIFFVGFIKNARSYLNAFDMVLLPSIKEGLPYIALEAGLAKLPVAASDIGGIPDIIESGTTGILFPAKNPTEIALAVEKLLTNDDLRRNLGEALYRKTIRDFSLSGMDQKTLAAYRS